MTGHGSKITALFFLVAIAFSLFTAATPAAANKVTTQAESSGYLSAELAKLDNPQTVKSMGVFETLVRLFFGLLIVIALIYIIMWAAKYFYVRASIPLKNESIIKVLAREYLDSKKSIYVVEFADRVLLLGGGTDNLSLLSEIKDPETIIKVKESADEYISKYRMKEESKFGEELKSAYLKQGKQAVDKGNEVVMKFMDRLKGGPKK